MKRKGDNLKNYHSLDFLRERLFVLGKERDALRKELDRLKKDRDELRKIVEKQARLNRTVTIMALELDTVKAERDALLARFGGLMDG